MDSDTLCALDQDGSATPGGAAWRGRGTLLVVDDDLGVRNVLQFLLERSGFTVLTAGDGRSALDIVRRRGSEIRLVLLDLVLPDTDGEAVLHAMRDIRPELAAILCTGHLEEWDVSRQSRVGWAAVVRKPFRLDALLQTVRAVLDD